MRIRVCWYKNAGVAGYAEAFRPVQSDSQTSEWYSYFENDVLVIYPAAKECMNNCTFGERDSIMTVLSDAAVTVRKIRQNENVKRNITNHNKYRKIEE